MRRQFVAQAQWFCLWCVLHLLAQGTEFDRQQVDLLLLAEDGAVQFVDQVFEAAGLPLVRVRAAASYSPQTIADLVRQTISGRAIPDKAVVKNADTPICPKCGTQMVLRTAKRGDQKGEEFWGCGNYPKCRETKGI